MERDQARLLAISEMMKDMNFTEEQLRATVVTMLDHIYKKNDDAILLYLTKLREYYTEVERSVVLN